MVYELAAKKNPSFDYALVERQIKMLDAFANGAEGKGLQALGIFYQHAGAAKDAFDQLDSTNSPLLNKSLLWLRDHAAGDPRVSRVLAAREPVANEYERFVAAANGTGALYESDRKSVAEILRLDQTLEQFDTTLKQMGHTVNARYREMNNRFRNTTKKDLADEFPMSDEALAAASKIGAPLHTGASMGATRATPAGGEAPASGASPTFKYNPATGKLE